MAERLTAMDGSFLRMETSNAHMHVAWSATFAVAPERPRPSLSRLRRSIAARLEHVPRFRRRLAYPLRGMGEPFWVDDPAFDVSRHVVELGMPNSELDDRRFGFLCDRVLSEPLPRDRPLWEIRLAPRLQGDRCGIVARIHHALVDGKSALEVALLLFDTDRDAAPGLPTRWRAPAAPGAARLSAGAIASGAGESLRAARSAVRMAAEPRGSASRLAGTLRRAALSAGEDLLRPAPLVRPERAHRTAAHAGAPLGAGGGPAGGQAALRGHAQRRVPDHGGGCPARAVARPRRATPGPEGDGARRRARERAVGLARQPHLVRVRGPPAGRGHTRAPSRPDPHRHGGLQARRQAGRRRVGAGRARSPPRSVARGGRASGGEPARLQPDDLERAGTARAALHARRRAARVPSGGPDRRGTRAVDRHVQPHRDAPLRALRGSRRLPAGP